MTRLFWCNENWVRSGKRLQYMAEFVSSQLPDDGAVVAGGGTRRGVRPSVAGREFALSGREWGRGEERASTHTGLRPEIYRISAFTSFATPATSSVATLVGPISDAKHSVSLRNYVKNLVVGSRTIVTNSLLVWIIRLRTFAARRGGGSLSASFQDASRSGRARLLRHRAHERR